MIIIEIAYGAVYPTIEVTYDTTQVDIVSGLDASPVTIELDYTSITSADMALKVPYTGATGDVDLGEYGLSAGYLQVDTTPTNTPGTQGTMYWDDNAETVALIMNGTIQKVGEDVFFHVQNQSGSLIPKGSCVRFDGTDGNSGKLLIAPFLADGTYPSQYFMGVTAEDIANGAPGKVYHFGKMRGINLSAYQDGDILYASTTVVGGFQTAVPTAPNNIIIVAAVVSAKNNGTLMIRSTLGSNINNDEGVKIVNPSNGDILAYNSTSGLWENISAGGGITSLNGLTPAVQTFATGSSGTDFNISSATSTHTFNIPTASATNRGLLSNSDWSAFNGKQPQLNGTGFVKASGTTITYDNTTYYPNSNPSNFIDLADLSAGTGISYDNTTGVITNAAPDQTVALTGAGTTSVSGTYPNFTITSADQYTGTVTSVDITVPTGLTVSGNPITSAGTLAIALASGYSIPTTAKQTEWDTAYTNRITALTTTGNSGAATLAANTLNVPEYTLSGLGGVPTTRTITINGTAQDLSADRTYNVGTVTSVAALTLGTTGTDLSSTVADGTTTPVITLNVPTASAINRGALSSTDWSTFNAKEPAITAGTSSQYWRGDKTFQTLNTAAVTESTNLYFTEDRVRGTVLTGLNLSAGGTIASTDSVLQAFGKVQNQISALVGGVIYKGTWNASTNTPTLASGTGSKGDYYIVTVDGTTNLDGITDWKIGDWAIFNGTTWDKVDNTDAVSSVNGYTGTVSLVTGDVLEGSGSLPSRPSQLYFTDGRARLALSAGTGISYDNTTGVITNSAPDQTVALTGAGTTSISGTYPNFTITSNDQYVGTVTSITASSPLTGGTITSSGTIGIQQATATQGGFLSAFDFSTFAGKQNTITLTTTGTSGAATFTGTILNIPQYQAALSGTGFVKISGTTISYDNSTYLTTSSASSTYLPLAGGTLTGALNGTSATFSGTFGQILNITGNSTGNNTTFYTATNGSGDSLQLGIVNAEYVNSSYPAIIARGAYLYSPQTLGLVAESGYPILFQTGGSTQLTIASTGAATFSSSVTAVSGIFNSTGKILEAKQSSAGAASYYVFDNTVEATGKKWRFGYTGAVADASTFSLYNETDDVLNFVAKGGNLGLGVTPSAWRTSFDQKTIQFGPVGFVYSLSASETNNQTFFGSNWYLNTSGSPIYIKSDFATSYSQVGGQHVWQISPSGTAGNAITFTQAMTLDASGNLGIGVNSMSGKLQVRGTSIQAWVEGSGNSSNAVLRLNATDSGGNYGSVVDLASIGVGTNTSAFTISTRDGGAVTERMRITSGGNVGIGTASPAERLHVETSNEYQITYARTGAGKRWALGIDTAGTYFNNRTDAILPLYITNGGNVGIGTTSPVAKLHVENTSSADPTSLSSTPSTNIFGMSTSPGGMLAAGIGTTGGTHVWLQGRNVAGAGVSYPISLQPLGGNVGIGTTSPSEKLEVNGNIKTAAPSGGTAKPIKFGAVQSASSLTGDALQVEIDGVFYLLGIVGSP